MMNLRKIVILLSFLFTNVLFSHAQYVTTGSGTSATYTSGLTGIGYSTSTGFLAQLQLAATTNNYQISLSGIPTNVNQFAGFGYNSSTLKYILPGTTSDHAFYAGVNATTINELVRIKGTGLIGIATNNPLDKLHLNNGIMRITGSSTPSNPTDVFSSGALRIGNNGTANSWIQAYNSNTAYSPLLLNPLGGYRIRRFKSAIQVRGNRASIF